ADTPPLNKVSVMDSLTDPALSPDVNSAFAATLVGSGQCESHDFSREVQADDPDPLVNTATAIYEVGDDFGNRLEASDDHTVNLFQPDISVVKTGDDLSKVGDTVNYTIKVCNDSSADTPPLNKVSVTDSLTGPALSPDVNSAFAATLVGAGQCESHDFSREVQADDPDPLVNTATAIYEVGNDFGNRLEASDDHTVNLFQPDISVVKTGDELSKVGDTVNYTIKVCNDSSADTPPLNKVSVTDSLTDPALSPDVDSA
ncbi:unnamed protein product, partial [marine sediment metagenome]